MMWEAWLVVGAALLGFLLGWFGKSRKVSRDIGELQSQYGSLLTNFEAVSDALVQANADREQANRLVQVHVEASCRLEAQRNEAWKLFRESGIRASNAQSMLFKSLEQAVRHLNRYRIADGKDLVKVNDGLKDIVSDFKRDYVEDVNPPQGAV